MYILITAWERLRSNRQIHGKKENQQGQGADKKLLFECIQIVAKQSAN